MHCFTDNQGRPWPILIHVSAVKHVRARLALDLYKLLDDGAKGLGELLADPCLLVDVLFVLCEEEANRRGVSDEDFGRAMAGDVLEQAAQAFLEELTDFFPNARGRAALKELIQKSKALQSRLLEHGANELANLNPETLADAFITQSGKPRASLESTPAPLPSANSS